MLYTVILPNIAQASEAVGYFGPIGFGSSRMVRLNGVYVYCPDLPRVS